MSDRTPATHESHVYSVCSECGHRQELVNVRGVGVAIGCSDWPRPIPVSERLPEVTGRYLAFYQHTMFFEPNWHAAWYAAHRNGREFAWLEDSDESDIIVEPTHWLPIPPIPAATPAP